MIFQLDYKPYPGVRKWLLFVYMCFYMIYIQAYVKITDMVELLWLAEFLQFIGWSRYCLRRFVVLYWMKVLWLVFVFRECDLTNPALICKKIVEGFIRKQRKTCANWATMYYIICWYWPKLDLLFGPPLHFWKQDFYKKW